MNEDEKVTEPAIVAAPDPMRFARAGRDMPTWDALPDRIRDAWAAGARAILIECTSGDNGAIDVIRTERDRR